MTQLPSLAQVESHFLFRDHRASLDRYLALLDEDQALRAGEYERPDPARRRLRVSCNQCTTPFCCNQQVDIDLAEALVLFRWALEHARPQLQEALRRGHELHQRQGRRRDPHPAPMSEDESFFRRRVPCPFLSQGRCTVYRVRPWPCRTHYMAGNPLKCRDQLQPAETYAMDPDPTLRAELAQLSEDLRFFAQVEAVEPRELSQVLHLVERLLALPPWRAPVRLGFDQTCQIGETGEPGEPRPPGYKVDRGRTRRR